MVSCTCTYVCLHVVHACMYSPAQPVHSGSLASCLCEEEEVLDWFHDLNAMKYCKQFVEKVPRGDYTCVFAHAHTQHTHGTILIRAQQHIHTTCVMLSLQGYNQLSDVARLDEEAIKQVVSSGGRIYCCWWWEGLLLLVVEGSTAAGGGRIYCWWWWEGLLLLVVGVTGVITV